jgi:3-hydroxybutyryl-CoA dehydratase
LVIKQPSSEFHFRPAKVQGSAMQGLTLEDLFVGQCSNLTRTVTEPDIAGFAEITGDRNPVHLDQAYAESTAFGTRIAHGMLSAGYMSAVIGTQLPGPGAIYLSQSLRFRRPVRVGDTVVARVEVAAINTHRARVTLLTTCRVNGEVVVDGEAEILAPRRGA